MWVCVNALEPFELGSEMKGPEEDTCKYYRYLVISFLTCFPYNNFTIRKIFLFYSCTAPCTVASSVLPGFSTVQKLITVLCFGSFIMQFNSIAAQRNLYRKAMRVSVFVYELQGLLDTS